MVQTCSLNCWEFCHCLAIEVVHSPHGSIHEKDEDGIENWVDVESVTLQMW